MCNCQRGLRGPQGPTGATGATGPAAEFLQTEITVTPIPSSTDISIVASAAQTGDIAFFGQLAFSSSAAINYSVSVLVNGTPYSSYTGRATGAAAISSFSYVTIPVSGIISVTATDAFEINVTLSDYTRSTQVEGLVQYSYQ